ncbi:MAG: toxin-antitoxin system HicB family antitoxin [Candidatus Aminicenantes bacterium]|nr:toxin-antitoxin system HicB family antitoxin [Candidatus Aminicenantes bacterium]
MSGRTYRRKFIFRGPPEVHLKPAIKGRRGGVSLNRLVSAKRSNLRVL